MSVIRKLGMQTISIDMNINTFRKSRGDWQIIWIRGV